MNQNDMNNRELTKEESSLLARIDERTIATSNDIKDLKLSLASSILEIKQGYVTRDKFTPIRNIVYGEVALILIAVIGALIAMVVK